MIPSSVRRVVFIVSTTPVACNLPRAIASNTATAHCPCHQRRASSSKPPSPDNESKGRVEARPVTSTPTDSSTAEAKRSATKKKAKSTNVKNVVRGKNKTTFNLPSVPSTQHITPSLLGPAAFFSLHRPISITNGFPQPVSKETFASIFTSKIRNHKPQEVVKTLSNTLDSMDSVVESLESFKLDPEQSQMTEFDGHQSDKTEDLFHKADIQRVQIDQILGQPPYFMSGRFAPFNPPELPRPHDNAEDVTKEPTEIQLTRRRVYTAILTVEEFIDSNGDITYAAHHSPLTADETSLKAKDFCGKNKQRLARYKFERITRRKMLAISVKRQRKLKMKKHKYKKLMRRTRNERRRLNRT